MEPKPTWQELCEAAANEQDPKKLMELIAKINRDLTEKEARLAQVQALQPAERFVSN